MKTYTYTVLFEHFHDDTHQGYTAVVPALPGCTTWGATLDEAKARAHDAIGGYVESLRKHNHPVPTEEADHPQAYIDKIKIQVAAV